MLTEFGIECRKLRLNRGMRLVDMGRLIGRSPTYMSFIETGRRPIPEGYVDLLEANFDLNGDERARLRSAATKTEKAKVFDLRADERERAAAFIRTVDQLPPELITVLKRHVLKNAAG
jgi:transcriptional regulator with XRE-family HTH domain